MRSFPVRAVTIAALFALALSAMPDASGQQETPMRYFRYNRARACNVYMNYSFWQPNFSLMARNPNALSAEDRAFIEEFNRSFQAMAVRGGMGNCEPPPGGMSNPRAREIYNRCMATQDRFGIAEQGWVNGRMPAPSNCISPKRDLAGTIRLVNGSLPTQTMSVSEWIRRSETGE